jgi:hypothetical protein
MARKKYDAPTRKALEAAGRSPDRPRQLEPEPEPERVAPQTPAQPAVWLVRCPTCGAQIGEFCRGRRGTDPHKRRITAAAPKKNNDPKRPQSVRTVPGGAFEMNRKRH